MKTMVGFDIAKNTVVAAVLAKDNKVLQTNITINNTQKDLRNWLAASLRQYGSLTTVCESTGYYHFKLVKAADELGIPCLVLNPILTKAAAKSTIRGSKTDPKDAVLVAKLGLNGEGVLVAKSDIDNQAKCWLRMAAKLQSVIQCLQLSQSSLIEREVEIPNAIARLQKQSIKQLRTVSRKYNQASIAATPKATLRLLISIPGIGEQTAATLMAEIGQVKRFSSALKLIAYSGFDPRVRQSGTSLHRNTRLTKRGSPWLRRAVFMAANVSRQYDPELKAYYQRKREEGRTHTEAMMPVCRKLLTRVYAVWKRGTPYIKST